MGLLFFYLFRQKDPTGTESKTDEVTTEGPLPQERSYYNDPDEPARQRVSEHEYIEIVDPPYYNVRHDGTERAPNAYYNTGGPEITNTRDDDNGNQLEAYYNTGPPEIS